MTIGFSKKDVVKVELYNVTLPTLTDGTYSGTYGGSVISFEDSVGLRWNVTVNKSIKGFGYKVTVEVKDGVITRITNII